MIRRWLWRLAVRWLSPTRVLDRTVHEALIAECRRLQGPEQPIWFQSALGVPFQLERRLRAELEATP